MPSAEPEGVTAGEPKLCIDMATDASSAAEKERVSLTKNLVPQDGGEQHFVSRQRSRGHDLASQLETAVDNGVALVVVSVAGLDVAGSGARGRPNLGLGVSQRDESASGSVGGSRVFGDCPPPHG